MGQKQLRLGQDEGLLAAFREAWLAAFERRTAEVQAPILPSEYDHLKVQIVREAMKAVGQQNEYREWGLSPKSPPPHLEYLNALAGLHGNLCKWKLRPLLRAGAAGGPANGSVKARVVWICEKYGRIPADRGYLGHLLGCSAQNLYHPFRELRERGWTCEEKGDWLLWCPPPEPEPVVEEEAVVEPEPQPCSLCGYPGGPGPLEACQVSVPDEGKDQEFYIEAVSMMDVAQRQAVERGELQVEMLRAASALLAQAEELLKSSAALSGGED